MQSNMYPRAKVFFGFLFAPLVGAGLLAITFIMSTLVQGDSTFRIGEAVGILLLFLVAGWILFAVPALGLAVLALRLEVTRGRADQLKMALLGGLLAAVWTALASFTNAGLVLLCAVLAAISAWCVSRWLLPTPLAQSTQADLEPRPLISR